MKTFPMYSRVEQHYKTVDVEPNRVREITKLEKKVNNACSLRLCHAFNQLDGHKIPEKPVGVHGHVWKGKDGYYIMGSRGMARYLSKTYKAPLKHSSAYHKQHFKNRSGILFFDIRFTNAYGHIALWNGKKAYRGEYFNGSTKVWFWELYGPGGWLLNLDPDEWLE